MNFFSAVQLAGHFSGAMKQNGWGRIVFISSLYSLVSKERRIAYSSSKNALTGLTKTLALELGQYHILVNAVAPGFVWTEALSKSGDDLLKKWKENIPIERFIKPEELAEVYVMIASSKIFTGSIIVADGGYTLLEKN